ncbi:MAG: magnesium-translocating P-type ATPase [Acidobacteriota bacterium]
MIESPSSSPPEARGLTSSEAARRLLEYGANEIETPRGSFLREVLPGLGNPLVLVLLAASAVASLAGEFVNAGIIVLMVLLSLVLNLVQTHRSRRAAEALRQRVAMTASALRDGVWVEVPRREIVPGDLIRLSAGDLVPADARLLEARDLHLQEAALTGESLPAEKTVAAAGAEEAVVRADRVYFGTSVVSGTGRALVTSTGGQTAFGDVVARLARRPPETEFERGTRRFGLFIMRLVFFLVLFVLLVNLLLKRDPLESLLFAVALAVGLTPEFLPMITTVTLAQGAVRMARHKVIVKHLEAIQNFGSIDVLCSDKTGTLTVGQMGLVGFCDALGAKSNRVLRLARLNSHFQTGIRSPLDLALEEEKPDDFAAYHMTDELPFDFERKRLSVVLSRGGACTLIAKGAPEGLLPACRDFEQGQARRPLEGEARERAEATYRGLCEKGFRVLAVAFRDLSGTEKGALRDDRDLTLAGFVAFSDPPVPGVAETLETLRRDGVRVVILTGDNELVARHVCQQVGLDVERLVLGEEIDRMTDAALAAVAEGASVFARVSPGQKNRVLLALKSRGHVVGYLGDGINDAPSLHAADVGISVSGAVEVAREAAEVILLERSLRVLHDGIREGRKSFGNVMKYLLMGTSSNFGNMFSMAAAAVFLPFLPMRPTQILLNDFLYDLAQVTIPTDRVDASYVRKPQRWNIGVIRDFMLVIGPISSLYDFLTFFALLRLFHASEALFQTGWFVESLSTQTLVLFVIRTAGSPFRSRPSKPLAITTVAVVAAGILLPYTPVAGPLGFVPLPGAFYPFLVGVTGTYLLFVEIVKRRLLGRKATSRRSRA